MMWPRKRRKKKNKNSSSSSTRPLLQGRAVSHQDDVSDDHDNDDESTLFEDLGSADALSPFQLELSKGLAAGSTALTLHDTLQSVKNDSRALYRLLCADKKRKKSPRSMQQAVGVVFLYSRSFGSTFSRKERLEKVSKLIQNDRLLTVVSYRKDQDLSNEPAYTELYLHTIISLQRYFENPESFGFLERTRSSEADFFVRFQRNGSNCSFLAPCTMMAYWMQRQGSSGAPVDVSDYIRHVLSDDSLYEYITRDSSTSSWQILQSLLHTPDALLSYSAKRLRYDKTVDLEALLRQFGPGLVSDFCVHENFCRRRELPEDVGYFQFDSGGLESMGEYVLLKERVGEYATAENDKVEMVMNDVEASDSTRTDRALRRHHSMILIGGRREGDKTWLLLQNFWEHMPLVEVSDEYLKYTGGFVSFITEESMRVAYTTNDSPIAACNDLDRPESIEQSFHGSKS